MEFEANIIDLSLLQEIKQDFLLIILFKKVE